MLAIASSRWEDDNQGFGTTGHWKKTCKEMCFKEAGLFFRPYSVHRLFPCFSFSFWVSWLPEEWLSVWYIWCCHLLCSSFLLRVYFLPSSPLPPLFSPVKVRHNTNQYLFSGSETEDSESRNGDSSKVSVTQVLGGSGAGDGGEGAKGLVFKLCLPSLLCLLSLLQNGPDAVAAWADASSWPRLHLALHTVRHKMWARKGALWTRSL